LLLVISENICHLKITVYVMSVNFTYSVTLYTDTGVTLYTDTGVTVYTDTGVTLYTHTGVTCTAAFFPQLITVWCQPHYS